MLDKHVVPVIKPALHRLAVSLADSGITADKITFAGFACGLLSVFSIAMGWYAAGLLLLLLNRLADGVDGEMARLKGATDAGAYLDITLDFCFYALLPLGFAFANPEVNALAAVVLVASFVGTGTTFLAYARFAESHGREHPDFAYKGFYYIDGLAEGTETVLFFIAMCLWPSGFPILALLFAAICAVTTFTRIFFGYRTLAG